jgi:hypothetical protein
MKQAQHVHFAGMGGAAMSRKQGPVTFWVTGCDRPRLAPAAGAADSPGVGDMR